MKIALVLSYDGSTYQGFQKQPKGYTVQNILEKALTELFLETISSIGAGRTDTGVHADEQIVTVQLPETLVKKMGFEKLAKILNDKLPPTMRIVHHFHVPDDFHPRFGAWVRLYRYSIYTPMSPHIPSIYLTKSFIYPYPLRHDLLYKILKVFEGTHDFTTFASSRDSHPSKIRTIYKIDCIEHGNELIIELYGNAFLREMVRSLIGNALLLMRKSLSETKARALLIERDPKLARARVPGHALTLTKIFYTNIFFNQRNNPKNNEKQSSFIWNK